MAGEQVSSNLREATISGARWTGSARLVRELVAFASVVVLARIVSPAEFGVAAVAFVVVALTPLLGTAGCTAPLVQRKELTSRLEGAVVLVCVALGVALTVVTIVASVLLVRPVFGGRTAELMLLAAPAWLLVALGAPSIALLQRAFRFRALAIVETAGAVLGSFAAVAYAVVGAGDTALVLGGLVLVGSSGLIALVVVPLRSVRTDRETVAEVIGFATPVTLSSLVYIGLRNVDYLIVGARSTPAQLGYYWRAFQLGVVYQSKISNIMQRVSLPVFAQSGSRGELRALHDRIVRTHATVLVPLLAMFIAAAPVLIPWLFGSVWKPAVVPAQIMSVAGMAEAITAGIGPLMVAIGRPGILLRYNLAVFGLYSAMIFLLVPYGIEVVAVGVAGFGVLTVMGVQVFIRRPFLGLTWRDLWSETRAGIVVGAAVLVFAAGLREALQTLGLPSLAVLCLLGAAALLVYVGLLRALFPTEMSDLRTIFRAVGGRKRASTPSGPDSNVA